MTKKRLIPLLFAIAYVAVPAAAVYVHAMLSDSGSYHVNDSNVLPVMPATFAAPPAKPQKTTAL